MNRRRWILVMIGVVVAVAGLWLAKREKPAIAPPPAPASKPTSQSATQPAFVPRLFGDDLFAGLSAKLASVTPQQPEWTPSSGSAFQLDIGMLAAGNHRLAGFKDPNAGSLRAGEYVRTRLELMGFVQEPNAPQRLFIQDFPIVQNFPGECTLEADGKKINILPLRPNVLQAVVTPPEGLVGKTLYAGKGLLADYGKQLPDGRIVVLDFDCENRWQDAYAMGAQAVIFIGSSEPAVSSQHFVLMPANLPRFFVTAEQAKELELTTRPREVKLVSTSRWAECTGRNVIACIRGTDPRFDKSDKNAMPQALVLAAPLDTYGEVPLLSPGARDAGNCAALLALADYLRVNRPRRDVILCFFDAQTLNHMGARAFYGAAFRGGSVKAIKLEEVRKNIEEETSFRRTILSLLEKVQANLENIAATQKPPFHDLASVIPEVVRKDERFHDLILILREAAKLKTNELMEDLRPLRIEAESLKYQSRALSDETKMDQLLKQADRLERDANMLQRTDDGWNMVLRTVHYQEFPEQKKDPDANYIDKHATVLAMTSTLTNETIALQKRRLEELGAALARNVQDIGLREEIGYGKQDVVLHLSLNLSDARNQWGLIHGENSMALHNDTVGNYGQLYIAIRAAIAGLARNTFFAPTIAQTFDSRMYAPGLYADSSAVARSFSFFNLAAMTIFDRMPRQGQPCDTLDRLDSNTMAAQALQLPSLVKALGDTAALDLTRNLAADAKIVEPKWAGNKSAGPSILGSGNALQARPAKDCFVTVLSGHWSAMAPSAIPPGFVPALMYKTNTNGNFAAGPYSITTYLNDKPIVWAAKHDDNGLFRAVTGALKGEDNLAKASVQLFRCLSKTVVGYGVDRGSSTTLAMREIPESATAFPGDRSLSCEVGNMLTLFAPYDAKGMKLFNLNGAVILHNNDTAREYLGDGISLRKPFEHPKTLQFTAHDLRILNEYRLKLLRSVRIHQGSLEVLQGEAKEIEERGASQLEALASGTADANASLQKPMGDLAAATAYSRGAYAPLVAVINDLVTAVVLLLLLAMPFAFALERLLIGTPHIYRQIAWFGLFFLLTFAVLYLVNPAFRIASTPVIIFLAFTIILLSTLVIFIMVRKLQAEIRKTQGLSLTVHSADVSRLSTMMAAVNMGISTMRRRPIRTVLTAATVVLLTFTILTFASFGSEYGVRSNYLGPMSGGDSRILIRQQLWAPLSDASFETLRGHFWDEATVIPRYWIAPTAAEAKAAAAANNAELRSLLTLEKPDQVVPFSAAIGLNPIDIRRQQLADHFDGKLELLEQNGVFLSDAYRKTLGLTEADVGKKNLLVYGYTMVYAGVARSTIASQTMLEGSSLMPVDYQSSSGDAQTTTTTSTVTETSDVQSHQFVNYSPDEVVIVSDASARRMGGKIRSITLYPAQPQRIAELGQRAAKITKLPTYVGEGGSVSRLYFTTLTSASGWKDLLIPVLLGGMIIFATMLGSVSDREREIYTFSSLGLAPPHVASLFFAEAAVYAVTGGMGGYLLGQIVARLLAWLSTLFNFSVPTMNYSSTNAIVTILIVMATVLVSTIYPALKASRSANPGIQRAWRIPNPVGNLYDLVFPFTVSAYDIVGVVTFLKGHFDNYSDTSLGVFATSDTAVFRQKNNNMLGLRATVALAPFDLGVNQRFALLSQPSDIEGIDEVRIMIARLSGAQGDWQRANRVFVNDLRKQLLIWRSLPTEVTDRYRQKTLESLAHLPVEQVDPTTIGEAS